MAELIINMTYYSLIGSFRLLWGLFGINPFPSHHNEETYWEPVQKTAGENEEDF